MILDKIVVSTAKRVAHSKEFIAPEKMKQKAEKCEINRDFPFKKALSKKELSQSPLFQQQFRFTE